MSQTFRCDTTALISYLYDDIDPVERDAVASHLERCEACARDVATLSVTRTQLAAWTPPELAGGFSVDPSDAVSAVGRTGLRLVTNQPAVPGPTVRKGEPAPWWRQPLPGWAQAVAASMIFGAGLALGASRGVPSAPAEMSQTSPPAQTSATVSAEDLARLEQLLRGEIAGVRETVAQRAPASSAPVSPDLRRVEALIAASEERQQRELALRTVQLVRDFDLQRQADLVKIQQALGQFQGTTNAEVRQHRDAIEDLARRVSQTGR